MMNYRSTTIKSKWIKTKWLLKSEQRKYIPQTLLFSRSSLTGMLARYPVVYFKPTDGTGGFNIFRITKLEKGYRIQLNTVKSRCSTLDALYHQLKKHTKDRTYLLQQGIHLTTTKGRPFDIRVLVQKSNKGIWKSTALYTKIGSPSKVATNYHQGGKPGFLKQTLSEAGFSKSSIQQKEAELKMLGVSVGRLFDRHKKGFQELGLDVALDKSGRAWILEVNTRPQFNSLKHIGDKSMYPRIISYARQYGRQK